MTRATITVEGRDEPWRLVVEPWAEVYDVPANVHAVVEVFDIASEEDGGFALEVSEQGKFLFFYEPRYTVQIGDIRYERDFGIKPIAGSADGT